MWFICLFPHGDQNISPQGQGFGILPSLWGHFVPITLDIPEPRTHTHSHTQTHSHTHSHTHGHTHTLSHIFTQTPHTHTHGHTQTHKHTNTHTHTVTLSHTLSLTHTRSHTEAHLDLDDDSHVTRHQCERSAGNWILQWLWIFHECSFTSYPVLMEMISISGFFLILGRSSRAPPRRLPFSFFWPSRRTEWPATHTRSRIITPQAMNTDWCQRDGIKDCALFQHNHTLASGHERERETIPPWASAACRQTDGADIETWPWIQPHHSVFRATEQWETLSWTLQMFTHTPRITTTWKLNQIPREAAVTRRDGDLWGLTHTHWNNLIHTHTIPLIIQQYTGILSMIWNKQS